MGGPDNGTNPEQLFALGYAACYHSALRLVGRQEKASVSISTVGACVSVGQLDNGGFGLHSDATRGNIDVKLVVTDD
jgi:lipoyl-dependent peroxiredoxin